LVCFFFFFFYFLYNSFLSFYRVERLQSDYEKEVGKNSTQKQLEKFKKKNRERTSLPRYLIEELLKKLGEILDTTSMNGLGLTGRISRIQNFDKMQEWKRTVEQYLKDISESNAVAEISTTSSLQTPGFTVTSIEQDDKNLDDNYRTVTTSLQQIIRDEHNSIDIEKLLISEQEFNHHVFENFYHVIQEVTNMVRYF